MKAPMKAPMKAMTCTRAQALIESASFMDWPAAEREAAERHAQGCEACRPLLAREIELVAGLQSLSSPVDVADLTATVMARIERAELRSPAAHPRRDADAASWWLLVAGALTTGVALMIWGPQAVGDLTARLPPSIRPGVEPAVLQAAVALIDIALYLAVLRMPLRAGREV